MPSTCWAWFSPAVSLPLWYLACRCPLCWKFFTKPTSVNTIAHLAGWAGLLAASEMLAAAESDADWRPVLSGLLHVSANSCQDIAVAACIPQGARRPPERHRLIDAYRPWDKLVRETVRGPHFHRAVIRAEQMP